MMMKKINENSRAHKRAERNGCVFGRYPVAAAFAAEYGGTVVEVWGARLVDITGIGGVRMEQIEYAVLR